MTAIPARHRAGRRSRTGLLVAWVMATLGGVLVAVTTRIGPVVLTITTNHGVHAGDLVGFGVCYGTVLLGTLLRPSRANGPLGRPQWPDGAFAQPGPPAPLPRPDRANGALGQPGRPNAPLAQRGGAAERYYEGPTRVLRLDEVVTRPLRLANAPTRDQPPRRRT